MRSGEEIALAAMKKEHARMSRVADRAKAEADEYMDVGTELVAIHREFAEIVNSRDHGDATMRKLANLRKRHDKADKILKKGSIKLMDKQAHAEIERDALVREISMLEFRLSRRRTLEAEK